LGRPVKRSLTLNGHRTSVSLEDAFWAGFRELARRKNLPLNALAAEIDAGRGQETGLATAIRLAVLQDLTDRLQTAEGQSDLSPTG
jgi:predicted DNA-binding ribbon-helix-helix protein